MPLEGPQQHERRATRRAPRTSCAALLHPLLSSRASPYGLSDQACLLPPITVCVLRLRLRWQKGGAGTGEGWLGMGPLGEDSGKVICVRLCGGAAE
jgi:hypothetical protein